MRAQESNTKPQGIQGPFPSFPFCIYYFIEPFEMAIQSTNPIDHEFYITFFNYNHEFLENDRCGIWIAPPGITNIHTLFSNGVPLCRYVTPGQPCWSNLAYAPPFMAGPFPKGHAIYITKDNTNNEKDSSMMCHGVIALDIYKDTNYPETRH